jgi:DNA-binding XRE family transcriptional regulator
MRSLPVVIDSTSLSEWPKCCKYSVRTCYVDVYSVSLHTVRVKPEAIGALQRRIGARLRELRRAKGISQEAFAEASGLHRTHMSLLERGRINATISTLHQVAKALGVSLSEFFRGI